MFGKWESGTGSVKAATPLRCSFCDKSQDDPEVRKLIAGPAVFICNECIAICNEIMADDQRFARGAVEPPEVQREQVSVSPSLSVTVRCALCKLPLFSSEALAIDARGALCPGCVDAVEAALAERHERQQE